MEKARVVEKYLQAWSLQVVGTPIVGNNAHVIPVVDVLDRPSMLRIGDPRGDCALAWRMLQEWDGDGAVRLYRHDVDEDVSLLERLDDRRTLDELPIDDAVTVAGRLRARLIRPVSYELPLLSELAARWTVALRMSPRIPSELGERAAGLCQDLAGTTVQSFLLNPDLHYHNVLAGSREPWLVIDPMPLIGDREFGLASLVWGRYDESTTDRLLSSLIETGGLDAERARAWTMVESTAKLLTSASPDVDRRCLAVAHDLDF
ncbi:MAG: aminoglycoside phosphotransferase family protein [Nakamurella sp.]